MKRLLIAIALSAFSIATTGFAQDLRSVMKNMGIHLKLISNQVTDPAKNQNSLTLADELLKSTQEARGLIPDTVTSLPSSEQPARAALYVKMIDHTADLIQQLIDALQKNDNAKAKQLVDSLVQTKKDGHGEFN